jgi:hypothetical protein
MSWMCDGSQKAQLVLGRPRKWYSMLWYLLSFGIAGTSGQAVAFRASSWFELFFHYGARRTMEEHLRIVRLKPTMLISNGDDIGRQSFLAFVLTIPVFFIVILGLFLSLRLLLPHSDRCYANMRPSNDGENYTGINFLIFIVLTLWMFFTMSFIPKLIVAALMVTMAWAVSYEFKRRATIVNR